MACRAVISAPLRSAASTTITPSDSPLISRFRCGNVPASGCARGGDFAEQRPVGGDLVGQLLVFGRIDVHHAAGQHGDRPSAGRQGAAMGRRVDAAGQPADDGQSRAGQAAGQPFGLPQAILRAVARADDAHGQGVVRPQLAADEQHARRIVNLAEHPRIGGVGFGEDVDAVLAAERDFGLGVDLVVGRGDPARQSSADAGDRRAVRSAPPPAPPGPSRTAPPAPCESSAPRRQSTTDASYRPCHQMIFAYLGAAISECLDSPPQQKGHSRWPSNSMSRAGAVTNYGGARQKIALPGLFSGRRHVGPGLSRRTDGC